MVAMDLKTPPAASRSVLGTRSPKPIVDTVMKQKYVESMKSQSSSQNSKMAAPKNRKPTKARL